MSQCARSEPLVVNPDEGRTYEMGRMSAIFKADLDETETSISVSEWRLEPNTEGPHIHKHPESHLFYILDGKLSVYLEGRSWFESIQGSYIFIPGWLDHGFENRSDSVVTFMSINTPGGFEASIPSIVDYFKDSPLGDAKRST